MVHLVQKEVKMNKSGPKPIPVEKRLWSKVEKTRGCWFWTGQTNGAGYGLLLRDGRTRLAHRIVWELENGPIPEGNLVRHMCDNPACVNPAHLRLGTQRDNMRDRLISARVHYAGVKLTADDVVNIVDLYKKGETQKSIAKRYGVSEPTVSGIMRGLCWQHVTNTLDLPARGRRNQCQRKLTDPQIVEIRSRYDRGEHQKQLSEEFGVSKALVQQIVTGKAWKHVR